MILADFITYLQGAGVTPTVTYALTMEPIESYADELPVILVFPIKEDPLPSGFDNLVIQANDVHIGCFLGCAVEDYETLLAELRSKVIGWVTGHYDAFEMAGASIEGIKGGYIWWRETYVTRIQIRQSL
jgi:hypothetical protein